jgi:hypothetical protein
MSAAREDLQMFVREERSVERSFEAVVDEFAGVPHGWLPDIAEETLGIGEGMTARLKAAGVSKKVSIQVGSVLRETSRVVMPMRVVATGPAGFFPQLDADLELLATGSSTATLRLTGSYRVPLGPPGRLLDRVLLHRVAEASLKHFLERVSERLLAHS